MRAEIKEVAKANKYEPATSIVERSQRKFLDPSQHIAQVKQSTLIRMANRTREQLRPKEPRDLQFELKEEFLPQAFLCHDIQHREERHLIFATDKQLRQLVRAKQWYIDGTFKVVRDPFVQLLSIHSFVRSGKNLKMVPLAFAVMSRRKTVDYKIVFRRPWLFVPPHPSYLEEMPAPPVAAYRRHGGIHNFIRNIMALPFLPATDIGRIFYKLCDKAEGNTKLKKFVDYVDRQWIQHDMFTPKSWSVFKVTVRTNNHVEGWHLRLKTKTNCHKLGIYQLTEVLKTEADVVNLQIRLVQNSVLTSRLRRKATQSQRRIFAAWNEYRDYDLSLMSLLTTCAQIHGPVE